MSLVRFAFLAVPVLLAAQQPVGVAPQPPANPQPTKPEDLCSVEGQVLNALTGEPLKKARITMSKDGDSGTGARDRHRRGRPLHGAGSRSGPLLPECQS